MSNCERLAELRERLAKLDNDISGLEYWGAAAAVLGEEQRSLKREIACVERQISKCAAIRARGGE